MPEILNFRKPGCVARARFAIAAAGEKRDAGLKNGRFRRMPSKWTVWKLRLDRGQAMRPSVRFGAVVAIGAAVAAYASTASAIAINVINNSGQDAGRILATAVGMVHAASRGIATGMVFNTASLHKPSGSTQLFTSDLIHPP